MASGGAASGEQGSGSSELVGGAGCVWDWNGSGAGDETGGGGPYI